MKLKFNKMIFVVLILIILFAYSYFNREMFTDEDRQYIVKAGKFDDYTTKYNTWLKANPSPKGNPDEYYKTWKPKEDAWKDAYVKNLK